MLPGRHYNHPVINGQRRGTSKLGGFSEGSEGDLLYSPGDLFQAIWRRLWVVLLTIVVCVGTAVGYSILQTPLYQASIKILVGQDQGLMIDPAQGANLQGLAFTLSEAVATRPVGERVVRDSDLKWSPEAIVAGTSAEVIPDTQFIEVTYTDTDPRRAQQIVNAIGDAFSEQVSEVSPQVSAISATVWERSDAPLSPVSPQPLRNGLVAFVIGVMLGVGLALLLEHLDDSWQSAEEAEQVSGVPTLVLIPTFESPQTKKG